MPVTKPKPKKRTRRAVKARRSLEDQEAAATKRLELWISKMKMAANKVDFYQRELKAVRRRMAQKESAEVFEGIV